MSPEAMTDPDGDLPSPRPRTASHVAHTAPPSLPNESLVDMPKPNRVASSPPQASDSDQLNITPPQPCLWSQGDSSSTESLPTHSLGSGAPLSQSDQIEAGGNLSVDALRAATRFAQEMLSQPASQMWQRMRAMERLLTDNEHDMALPELREMMVSLTHELRRLANITHLLEGIQNELSQLRQRYHDSLAEHAAQLQEVRMESLEQRVSTTALQRALQVRHDGEAGGCVTQGQDELQHPRSARTRTQQASEASVARQALLLAEENASSRARTSALEQQCARLQRGLSETQTTRHLQLQRAAAQRRRVVELKRQVRTLEETSAACAESYERRRRADLAAAAATLGVVERERDEARHLATSLQSELRRLRAVAQRALCEHDDVEQFFHAALREVREAIVLERQRAIACAPFASLPPPPPGSVAAAVTQSPPASAAIEPLMQAVSVRTTAATTIATTLGAMSSISAYSAAGNARTMANTAVVSSSPSATLTNRSAALRLTAQSRLLLTDVPSSNTIIAPLPPRRAAAANTTVATARVAIASHTAAAAAGSVDASAAAAASSAALVLLPSSSSSSSSSKKVDSPSKRWRAGHAAGNTLSHALPARRSRIVNDASDYVSTSAAATMPTTLASSTAVVPPSSSLSLPPLADRGVTGLSSTRALVPATHPAAIPPPQSAAVVAGTTGRGDDRSDTACLADVLRCAHTGSCSHVNCTPSDLCTSSLTAEADACTSVSQPMQGSAAAAVTLPYALTTAQLRQVDVGQLSWADKERVIASILRRIRLQCQNRMRATQQKREQSLQAKEDEPPLSDKENPHQQQRRVHEGMIEGEIRLCSDAVAGGGGMTTTETVDNQEDVRTFLTQECAIALR